MAACSRMKLSFEQANFCISRRFRILFWTATALGKKCVYKEVEVNIAYVEEPADLCNEHLNLHIDCVIHPLLSYPRSCCVLGLESLI